MPLDPLNDAFKTAPLEETNEGGRFVDRSANVMGAELPFLVSSVSAVDYDRDGLLDVYLSTYAFETLLLEREERGLFSPKACLPEFLPAADAAELYGLYSAAESHLIRNCPGPPNVLLRNRGGHYLTFASGDVWVKGGTNVPENLLGYSGFDNTPSGRHSYPSHAADWNPGDPDWNGGAGRAIVGLLNSLSTAGANSINGIPLTTSNNNNNRAWGGIR